MFSQPCLRSAVLSTLAILLLILASAGAQGAGASQATISSAAKSAGATIQPCAELITPFNAAHFPNPPKVDNTYYPLVPGTQFIMEGRANRTGEPLPQEVIFTVTDLTKVVHGVRTIVLWDQDINDGVLVEAELAFHAQDNAGNVWVLGEYPEEYKGGKFTGAPSTWFSGQANAVGGTLVVGNPQVSTPMFLQAYAPPDIINDCGQVSKTGQQICNDIGCYDNVLVIDETSPPEPGTQQKYYAPGVGNVQVGALNDPEGEALVLKQKVQLSVGACVAARNEALKLEQHAYQVSPNLYGKTAPMEQTGACESTAPTATPTTEPTATPTTDPTATPTAPTTTPHTAPDLSLYLPSIVKNLPPNPPPAIYDECQSDPDQAGAANFPVRIVSVNKVAETVTLENISDKTVSLEDWNLCSLATNRDHDQIFGTIAPGQIRTLANTGDGPVWNDSTRNDAALYNAGGFLVSYWVDE